MTSRRAAIVLSLCLTAWSFARPVRAALFPDSPFSGEAAGTAGAAFLKIPASARALALGTSYVAVADSSEAMFWNPAGLARMEEAGKSDVTMSYNALLETSYLSTLAYARPISQNRGVVGASIIYFSQSSLQGYNTLGDSDGTFTPYDFAFTGAYAKKVGRVNLGGAIKYIRSNVADASGTAFALDLGLQAERITDIGEGPLDLAVSIRNLGPAIKVGNVTDPLPFKLHLGSRWRISPNFSAMLDGHIPVDESPYPTLGAEWRYPVGKDLRAAFRAGYNVRNDRDIDGLTGFSAGFGVGMARARIDYAWVPLGDLGMTHRISLGFSF